ncbi:hypothetical protein IC232_03200 [Microvirga sp. BT688]|uniref:hypothetical protein n=1 Tax=Microvirga sp. TaxID=1873136 RepID=UPI001686A230|nr:hypothetical protein [Microvirga sp.]MBD2745695.1 hypothetical protein [Microvirga sp.]
MINASLRSNDGILKLSFDATPWFAKASDDEIFALATAGWGGSTATDELIRYIGSCNPQAASFLAEMKLPEPPNGTAAPIKVNIEEAPAGGWLVENRPALAARILAETAEEDDHS